MNKRSKAGMPLEEARAAAARIVRMLTPAKHTRAAIAALMLGAALTFAGCPNPDTDKTNTENPEPES